MRTIPTAAELRIGPAKGELDAVVDLGDGGITRDKQVSADQAADRTGTDAELVDVRQVGIEHTASHNTRAVDRGALPMGNFGVRAAVIPSALRDPTVGGRRAALHPVAMRAAPSHPQSPTIILYMGDDHSPTPLLDSPRDRSTYR